MDVTTDDITCASIGFSSVLPASGRDATSPSGIYLYSQIFWFSGILAAGLARAVRLTVVALATCLKATPVILHVLSIKSLAVHFLKHVHMFLQ